MSGVNRADMKKRILAGVLAAALVLFVMFSVFFIAHEADHDCTGEDCPVCTLIHICENNIKQLGSGIGAAVAVISLVQFIMTATACFGEPGSVSTLVSIKVRLNN